MTQNFPGNRNLTFRVEFRVNGELVGIDANSLSYSIYNLSGSVLAGPVTPTVSQGTREYDIAVSAAVNTKSSTFDGRIIEYNYQVNGSTFHGRVNYWLTDFLPIMTTAAQVRNLLGLNAEELTDEMVDLYAAYSEFSDYLNQNYGLSLNTLLTVGDRRTQAANTALAVWAALNFVHQAPMLAAYAVGATEQKFTRFAEINWKDLKLQLKARLNTELSKLGVTSTTLTRFGLAVLPDIITGEDA